MRLKGPVFAAGLAISATLAAAMRTARRMARALRFMLVQPWKADCTSASYHRHQVQRLVVPMLTVD
jgi:hypothetical protein